MFLLAKAPNLFVSSLTSRVTASSPDQFNLETYFLKGHAKDGVTIVILSSFQNKGKFLQQNV